MNGKDTYYFHASGLFWGGKGSNKTGRRECGNVSLFWNILFPKKEEKFEVNMVKMLTFG